MATISVRDTFARGFVGTTNQIQFPVVPPEEERRLFQRFDDEIQRRQLVIARDPALNNGIRIVYVAYFFYVRRWGQNSNHVFQTFVRFLAIEIHRRYNQTPQGIQVGIGRDRIIRSTRDIVINISRDTLAEVRASEIIQANTRGFLTRLGIRRLRQQQQQQQNMTLAAAQARTVVAIRESLKTEPFFGNSTDELDSFFSQVDSLMEMNGYVHNLGAVNANNTAGWLTQYRREVLAITLNFRGQVSTLWGDIRVSNMALGGFTPYTWNDDNYTHPDNNQAGALLYQGLCTLLRNAFLNPTPLAEPNYKSIDWSPVKFSGRSGEVALLIQTVRAIATQHCLPWDPYQQQRLPERHGFAIVAGIAARFTGPASDWWTQLPNKPTQIEVTIDDAHPENGLLNRIRNEFRSLTHSVDHLRRLQNMKWDEKQPLVEFNVEFDYTLREANQLNTDRNIMIDYYCKTLPSNLAMAIRDTLDGYAILDPRNVTLENAMKLAIQKNSTLALERSHSSKSAVLEAGKNAKSLD
jgi:hypothetical protein